jgi:hypothetical protein
MMFITRTSPKQVNREKNRERVACRKSLVERSGQAMEQVKKSGPVWLVIVSIGTQNRPEFWKAQRDTWARGHAFMASVEADTLPCLNCTSAFSKNLWWKPRDASPSWWCAQKRQLQAIRAASGHFKHATWFLVVDDDTWVNIVVLQGMLSQLEHEEILPTYIGHVAWNGAMQQQREQGTVIRARLQAMGGAGVVLHASAMQRLMASDSNGEDSTWHLREPGSSLIDKCIAEARHGSWCWWNSDWILAECLALAGIRPTGHPLFAQVESCHDLSMTCHRVNYSQQHALWRRASDLWLPCNETNHSRPTLKKSRCTRHYRPGTE